jgi:hypothetical protein
MPRPRKDTSQLSAEEILRLERDRQRKAEQAEIERLSRAVSSGDQDPTAVRAVWIANLKALGTEARAKLDTHQAEWIRIHKYLRNPFRLGDDNLDIVIGDVEEFIKVCPLSPGCGDGNTLSIYDQMLYFGILDDHFSEFFLDQMPQYFRRFGLFLDHTNIRAYRSFQKQIVCWWKRHHHRDGVADFGWESNDIWDEIAATQTFTSFNETTYCCDDYDSSAPPCTDNPNCWRLQTSSILAPEPDKGQRPGRSPGAREIALRRKLDLAAHEAQSRMSRTIDPVDPLILYAGRVCDDR